MELVNIRKKELNKVGYSDLLDWLQDPNHVYIGRRNIYVNGTFDSKWKNPFSVKKYGRDECIRKYEQYIMNNPKLLNDLDELKGKILGCWCYPEPCHGNVLINLINKI